MEEFPAGMRHKLYQTDTVTNESVCIAMFMMSSDAHHTKEALEAIYCHNPHGRTKFSIVSR